METKLKDAIEEYQCTGCVNGGDISCYIKNTISGFGCGKHLSGTILTQIGTILPGLPKGFNRIGVDKELRPNIYEKFIDSEWTYDMFNVPVWKYLTKEKHTIVRGIRPRLNSPFLHIFLEDCMQDINCLEITKDDIDSMD